MSSAMIPLLRFVESLEAQRLYHQVVEDGAEVADTGLLAPMGHPVGDERHHQGTAQVHPEAGPGEAQVPHGAWRGVANEVARAGVLQRGGVEAHGPRAAGHERIRGERAVPQGPGREGGIARAPLQHRLPEAGHVHRGAKEPRVPAHTVHHPGIVVVHLAGRAGPARHVCPQALLTGSGLPGTGGAGGSGLAVRGQLREAVEARPEPQRLSDMTEKENLQRSSGRAGEDLPQEDEPHVAVGGPGTAGGGERGARGGLDERLARPGPDRRGAGRIEQLWGRGERLGEEGHKGRKPRAVVQQVGHGGSGLPDGRAGKETLHPRLRAQLAVRPEAQEERGRAEHLGERGQVKPRVARGCAGHASKHLDAAVEHDGLSGREDLELHGLFEDGLEATDDTHSRTAPSRKESWALSASKRTVTPRGTGKFSAPWPMGKPAAQGSPSSWASERSTSALVYSAPFSSHAVKSPRTMPRTCWKSPASRSWVHMRSNR
ncbi:prephenate dehydrogenase [Stigmatella aurantiaca DW4/3-1]|uniref:Prephenate dehydrogenase n=1 Tax=Stigmatella aurantiaca (strain DW4/3-1) TaxID=378806 RepID=Q095D0_STIAD|nr:prephenate dehydrogenase [Stigmatella aurantiaca DW4/3-1]